ncbi:MAG TPA: cysteine--tRNA ligase [Patescibacteria group bacterium]|nr:cysteine--tRNA ligase [Patescibacteria group bacterium]
MLELYDTLKKKTVAIDRRGHLNLYTCGPTVYNYAHIGNLRSYVMADLLYRVLKQDGYAPRWVMNITDVDDKTIKGAIAQSGPAAGVADLRQFTQVYFDEFLKDLAEVGVLHGEIKFIRVTDVIPQIQEFIVGLANKGYAYKAEDGSTYFSIEKYQRDFGDYGELVGERFLEGKKVGARVAVDEYEKDNLSDFALWKAWQPAADGQIFWDHPQLGRGRPGWHIECSVINQIGFGGEATDIHTGGVDLIFPHHTNEIAQSQALLGPGNFVRHWFHSEHLLVDGKKMAKSSGNFYTLRDIQDKGFSGQDLRYLALSAAYGSRQNFTFEDLAAARTARLRYSSPAPVEYPETFLRAVNNNLNLPKAVASAIAAGGLGRVEPVLGLSAAEQADKLPKQVQALAEQRRQARQSRDFARSDELRKQLEAVGYEVMDTPDGQKVRRKITG